MHDLPCDADESQLHAGSVHPLQLASSLESPQLTDHLGEACLVRIATDIAATPAVHPCCVSAAHRETSILALAVQMRDCSG